MKSEAKSILIAILLLKTISCVFKMPMVDIYLDEEPELRWQNCVDVILKAHSWQESFGGIF